MALSDFRQSIRSVLNERLSSPFYGAFFVSWAVWNWKIIYLTIFIDSEAIWPKTKINYIVENYFQWYYLWALPLISAVFLITVVPFLSNLLYKTSLWFERKRRIAKESHDNERRLTVEQSRLLMSEIFDQDQQHIRELTAKTAEIEELTNRNQSHMDVIDRMKTDLETLQIEQKKFKVLYALYGKDDQVTDVTSQTSLLLEQNNHFQVNNEDLNGDPAPNIYKDFLLVYQSEGRVVPLRGKEHDIITIDNGVLTISQSEISRGVHNAVTNERLAKIFPGKWKLEYEGDTTGEEEVEIRANGEYWARFPGHEVFHHLFNLEEIFIHESNGEFEFTKVAVQPHDTRKLKNHLKIIEKRKKYSGTEDGNKRSVIYSKID